MKNLKSKKWLQITALALSLPSTIFFSVIVTMKLVDHNILTKLQALLIFLLIIFGILFLMVFYAYKYKDKS